MRWDKLEGAPRKKINIVTDLAILWLLVSVSVRCEGNGDVAPAAANFSTFGTFSGGCNKECGQ